MAKAVGRGGGTGDAAGGGVAGGGEAGDGGSDDDDDDEEEEELEPDFFPSSIFCHLFILLLIDAGLIESLQYCKWPIFCAYTSCSKGRTERLRATNVFVLDDGGRLYGNHITISFIYPGMSISKDIGECSDTQEDLLVLTRKMPPNYLIIVVVLIANMELMTDVVCLNLAEMEFSTDRGLISAHRCRIEY